MADFSKKEIIKDMEEAADRMGLELDDLQEMIVEVLTDCTTKAQSIQKAIGAKDIAKIKSIAHDIKGSTANYGLLHPSATALEIERNSESLPVESAAKLLDYLQTLSGLNLDVND